jgi:nucleotide-binding universal stress UspA family protein
MFDGLPLDLVTVTGQPIGPEDEWQAHVRLVGQLQRAVGDRLREGGRSPHEVLLTGRPATEIVEHVRASGASLIVLGAHDQSHLDKLFLGSTTLEVLTHSAASVLVAREPIAWTGGTREVLPLETSEREVLAGTGTLVGGMQEYHRG